MDPIPKIFSASLLVFLLSFSIVSISTASAYSDGDSSPEFIPGQVIVSFNPNAKSHDVDGFFESMSKAYGVSKIRDLDREVQDANDLQEKLVRVPEGHERQFLKILSKNPNVELTELNYVVHITDTIPNDSSFSSLWGLHNLGQTGGTSDADIDAPLAWDTSTGSSDIVVGVIDTGMDYTHPDLDGNVWVNLPELNGIPTVDDDGNGYTDDIYGIDVINGDSDPMDDHDHGTHVAGTIGAEGNNNLGVVGVNWHVSIMACKFLSASGSGSTAGATECFEYLKSMKDNHGVNIVATNNSWGGGGFSQTLNNAMANMPNTLHFIAAGNDNNNNDANDYWPANNPIPNKMVIAATDDNDNYASFSSYGAQKVDLAAPGVSILSTVPGGGYSSFSGTSMATPHAAGAAALIWANDPTLNQDKVQDIIRCNTDPITDSKKTKTNGRLNIGNALDKNDNSSPSPIVDFAVDQAGFSSAFVSFTSTGDDANSGTATCYEFRYSTSPITDENSWNNANVVFAESRPQSPGNNENLAIRGLDPETTYYLGVKVGDNAGNFSPMSNIVTTTTAPGVIEFNEDADNFDSTQWNWDGLWHTSNLRANTGDWSWHYADQSTNTYNVNFTNNGNSGTLETRTIDLTDATEARLTFSEWSEVEISSSYDRTRVGISTGGNFFTTILESHGTNDQWEDRSFDLKDYVGQEIKIGFNFDTVDSMFNDYEGWYVDNIEVRKYVPGANPPNNPPTANDDAGSVNEGDTTNIDLAGNDTDSDGTIDLTSITQVSPPSNGSIVINSDGTVDYTHDGSETTTDSFTYTIKDNDGATSIAATVSVTINPVNDLPTANAGSDQNVNENTNVSLSGSGTDADGTIASYAWTQTAGTAVTLSDDTAQSPSFTAPEVGPGGETLTFSLVVTDDDGASSTNTATVSVNVADVAVPNNPPTTTQIADQIVLEDAADTEITLTNYFDDAEDGPSGLTYTVFANDNPGLVGTSISGGSLTLSYTPNASGEANITIRATDSGSLTVDDTFNVVVLEENDNPTVQPIDDVTVPANSADTVIDLTAYFDDIEDGPSGLTYTVFANDNSGLVGTSISGGSLTLSYTPNASGEANITIRATDSGSLTVDDTFLVTVDAVSAASAELIKPSEGQQVSGKTKVEWSLSGFSGQITVQIYIDDLSNLKTTVVSGKTSYMWNTSEDGTGPHTILLEVIDTSGNSASDSKNVEVVAEQKGGGNPNKGGPNKN